MLSIKTNTFFKNFSWLIFDKVFMMFASLVILINVANHYGASEYGVYQYALSLNLIFGVIILFADEKVVKKLFSQEDEYRILLNTIIAKITLSAISFIVGLVLLFFLNESYTFNLIYLLVLFNQIITNSTFGLVCYFDYHLESKKVVFASSISNVISVALQLIAITLNYPIIIIASVVLFSSIIKSLVIFYQFKRCSRHRKDTRKFKVEKTLVYRIIKNSTPLAIASAAAMIYARTDQAMVGKMLGMQEVGIYSISIQFMSVVTIAIAPIQTSIFPKMIAWHKKNQDLYYKKYQKITTLVTWLCIFGISASVVVTPIVFSNLFGNEYSRSLDVFMIHVLGAFFMYNAVLRSSHFTIIGYTKVLMVSQTIAVFVNIFLNYVLITKFGLTGAALATIITQFLSLFLSNLMFSRSKNIFWIQLKGINPFIIFQNNKR